MRTVISLTPGCVVVVVILRDVCGVVVVVHAAVSHGDANAMHEAVIEMNGYAVFVVLRGGSAIVVVIPSTHSMKANRLRF